MELRFGAKRNFLTQNFLLKDHALHHKGLFCERPKSAVTKSMTIPRLDCSLSRGHCFYINITLGFSASVIFLFPSFVSRSPPGSSITMETKHLRVLLHLNVSSWCVRQHSTVLTHPSPQKKKNRGNSLL